MASTILLVEDQDDDVALLRRAFRKCRIVNPLQVVADGESAMAYLEGSGRYADRAVFPVPILVLLDLKLPRKSGLEVLEWMKRTALIRRLPVVVFTSSHEQRDIKKAYDLGANSYLVKPVQLDELQKIVERLHLYWVTSNVSAEIAAP